MARKSRKSDQQAAIEERSVITSEDVIVTNRTAIYTRLSLYDAYRVDPDSMKYQILYLQEYVSNHMDLNLIETYVDNGETGMNYERPSFQRLIQDIYDGQINCVVVKDLSRFGRNYIETGMYLQDIFPARHIRFIAVNDEYDSKYNDANDLSVILKNILNDFFSRDLSRKMSASIDIRYLTGPLHTGRPTYGYLTDPEDHNHLLKDPETELYVNLIFEWYFAGESFSEIAQRFNDMHVTGPVRLHYQRNPKQKELRYPGPPVWSPNTIRGLILNQIYAGDTVNCKTRNRRYTLEGYCQTNPDEWIVYPDTHEGYITHEQYAEILQTLEKRKHPKDQVLLMRFADADIVDLYKGLFYCSICNRKIHFAYNIKKKQYSYPYYNCLSLSYQWAIPDHHLTIRKTYLDTMVLDQLRSEFHKAQDYESWLSTPETIMKINSHFSCLERDLTDLKNQESLIKEKKTHLLEFQVDQILSQEDLILGMNQMDQEIQKLQKEIETAYTDLAKDRSALSLANPWLLVFHGQLPPDHLTADITHQYIQQMLLHPDQKVVIHFKEEYWRERLSSIYKILEQEAPENDL